jgi:hypothetical protein
MRTAVLGRMGMVALGLALEAGCLVTVDHVADPSSAFAAARTEAQALAGRSGRAREVNVLAYDPDDHELVRVSVPLSLAKKACHEGRLELSEGGDRAEGRAARAVSRHVSLDDLERAGRGVLVEAEEDAGERVLIWLR